MSDLGVCPLLTHDPAQTSHVRHLQSPLDISTAGAASKGRDGDGGLEFDYGKLRNVTVFNTGFGPQACLLACS
jgi:hypothetical protein